MMRPKFNRFLISFRPNQNNYASSTNLHILRSNSQYHQLANRKNILNQHQIQIQSITHSNRRYFSNSNQDWKNQNSKYNLNAYMRLCRWHQPIGAMLLYWPTAWGVCIGSCGVPSPYLLLLFLMGSWTARSAGCIVNDYFDKDFDKKVERTKTRPLASGQLTVKQAAVLLFLNLCGGLFVLFHLPKSALIFTFLMVGISGAYPLAKRFTNYPQVVLGIAFNSGIIIGALTANPTMFVPIMIPMYISGILWTLVYDTVYAYQDLDDDLKIGVKSTAVTWHKKDPMKIMERLIYMMGICHLILPILDIDYQFSFVMMLLLDGFLLAALKKLNLKDKKACGEFFKKNNMYGFGIFISLIICGFVKQWRSYCDKNAMVKE